jgi:hypothetical protein
MELKFLLLSFMLVVVVISISDSVATSALVLSLLANFISLGNHFSRIGENVNKQKKEGFDIARACDDNVPLLDEINPDSISTVQDDTASKQYFSFTDGYHTYNADDRMAFIGQGGGRNAKAQIDGYVSKTADYNKYFYGNEFALAEQRPWWEDALDGYDNLPDDYNKTYCNSVQRFD